MLETSFLVRSVGESSAVFLASVSHGLGTNPAGGSFRCRGRIYGKVF